MTNSSQMMPCPGNKSETRGDKLSLYLHSNLCSKISIPAVLLIHVCIDTINDNSDEIMIMIVMIMNKENTRLIIVMDIVVIYKMQLFSLDQIVVIKGYHGSSDKSENGYTVKHNDETDQDTPFGSQIQHVASHMGYFRIQY